LLHLEGHVLPDCCWLESRDADKRRLDG
jgi:hypothetical protein